MGVAYVGRVKGWRLEELWAWHRLGASRAVAHVQ